MGKSKRVVTLKVQCRCGYLGAIWVGNNLHCSNRECQSLIRFKGEGSLPVAVPEGSEGSSWNPIASVEQVRIIDSDRWPIASTSNNYTDGVDKSSHKVFDPDLAEKLFERFGCGNGQICDDDSCTLC